MVIRAYNLTTQDNTTILKHVKPGTICTCPDGSIIISDKQDNIFKQLAYNGEGCKVIHSVTTKLAPGTIINVDQMCFFGAPFSDIIIALVQSDDCRQLRVWGIKSSTGHVLMTKRRSSYGLRLPFAFWWNAYLNQFDILKPLNEPSLMKKICSKVSNISEEVHTAFCGNGCVAVKHGSQKQTTITCFKLTRKTDEHDIKYLEIP